MTRDSAAFTTVNVLLPSGGVHSFADISHVSFVNDESYGPARTFGVQEGSDGHITLIVCPRNVAAVEVEV